jgi:hypothetical protein
VSVIGLVTPAFANFQKPRKLHGRPWTKLHLFVHGALILPENVQTAVLVEFAAIHIQQDFEFPGKKRIACDGSAYYFGYEFVEAMKLNLEFAEVFRRHAETLSAEAREV